MIFSLFMLLYFLIDYTILHFQCRSVSIVFKVCKFIPPLVNYALYIECILQHGHAYINMGVAKPKKQSFEHNQLFGVFLDLII